MIQPQGGPSPVDQASPPRQVFFEVAHETRYEYPEEVTASYSRAHLTPRDLPRQVCLSSTLEVDPVPSEQRQRTDFYGNRWTYLHMGRSHTRLSVISKSVVEVTPPPAPQDSATWEEVRDALAGEGLGPEWLAAREFVLPSPRVLITDEIRQYARASFTPGQGIVAALEDLVHRIHADFKYDSKATTVSTTLPEVMVRRAGVCQDFAHLATACVRSMGLAARYVSGYLETRPPPGKPRLQGADASHAWCDVLLPVSGWVGIDPTNNKFVDDRFITTAWGRDYGDVAPLSGVIFTDGTRHTMKVTVDVLRLP